MSLDSASALIVSYFPCIFWGTTLSPPTGAAGAGLRSTAFIYGPIWTNEVSLDSASALVVSYFL